MSLFRRHESLVIVRMPLRLCTVVFCAKTSASAYSVQKVTSLHKDWLRIGQRPNSIHDAVILSSINMDSESNIACLGLDPQYSCSKRLSILQQGYIRSTHLSPMHRHLSQIPHTGEHGPLLRRATNAYRATHRRMECIQRPTLPGRATDRCAITEMDLCRLIRSIPQQCASM